MSAVYQSTDCGCLWYTWSNIFYPAPDFHPIDWEQPLLFTGHLQYGERIMQTKFARIFWAMIHLVFKLFNYWYQNFLLKRSPWLNNVYYYYYCYCYYYCCKWNAWTSSFIFWIFWMVNHVLKAFIVECWSIPLIDPWSTLNQYLINWHLGWHSINIWADTQLTIIVDWASTKYQWGVDQVLIRMSGIGQESRLTLKHRCLQYTWSQKTGKFTTPKSNF